MHYVIGLYQTWYVDMPLSQYEVYPDKFILHMSSSLMPYLLFRMPARLLPFLESVLEVLSSILEVTITI